MPDEVLLSAAQLDGVWLTSVTFAENRLLDPDRKPTYSLTHTTDVDLFDDEDGNPLGLLELHAKVDWAADVDGEPVEPPFELALTVVGIFAFNPQRQRDERFASAWLDYNGVYLLWPYLRTYISTITGLSTLPPLTIYTMRVPNPPVGGEEITDPRPGAPQTKDSAPASN